jgi:agmatine deiminase
MIAAALHGWRQPAEWEPHEACWLAWPSHPAEWPGPRVLEGARRAVAQMASALAPGERVELLVLPGESEDSARRAVEGEGVRFHAIPFGDVWLRDTGPIFLRGPDGALGAACFGWNGWGGKFLFEHDAEVCGRIADAAGARRFHSPMVLEGGAIEVDGEGTLLTTRQCLLHPSRNPGMDEAEIERRLREDLNARRVLWLNRGLANDHTDGHIDTLVRFVAPGRVVCMEPSGAGDPNGDALAEILRDLAGMRDAAGRRLDVVRIPSPGRIEMPDGALAPASYVNFLVGNRAVLAPIYGAPGDREAIAALAELFPGREIVAVDALAAVSGGGALHCMSREQAAGGATQPAASGRPGGER